MISMLKNQTLWVFFSNLHLLTGYRKIQSLDENIKLLDFAKRDQKLGCRKFAEKLKKGKTAAADILKNKKKIREQYELFHEKFR